MGFSTPEYWSGQPFPSPGDLTNPGIKPRSPPLQADSLPAEPLGQPNYLREVLIMKYGLPWWLSWERICLPWWRPGSIPGLVRSPGEGKGYPLQYSGLQNSIDCIVHGVTKSQTRLSDFHFLNKFFSLLGKDEIQFKQVNNLNLMITEEVMETLKQI